MQPDGQALMISIAWSYYLEQDAISQTLGYLARTFQAVSGMK
jgi:hypothetical protein